jgi:ketosteroid isomerase-like protein
LFCHDRAVLVGWLVRRRLTATFADIGRRDVGRLLQGLAPDVHHRFAGEHALGGERHSRESVGRWFDRLFRLYPSLTFTLHRVLVSGWPWDLTATVEWTARAVPQQGPAYVNVGAHVIRIQRGRVTHIHAYEDSAAVLQALRVMAAAGIAEASAEPIT